MSSTYYGQAVIVELPDVRSYDPRTGWRVTKRWRGTPDAIRQKTQEVVNAKMQCTLEPSDDGGYDVLSASYGVDLYDGTGATLADQWSLQGNDLEKSIWELPAVKTELAKITDSSKVGLLRSDIEALARGDETIRDESGEEIDLTETALLDVAVALGCTRSVIKSLIDSMSRGVDSFLVSQYVLRHTVTVASGSSIRASYTGVGYVYSTDQLTAAETIPNNIIFSLPTGVWLKRTPTVDQISYDRWQIVQEWWHADAYDSFIYTAYS